MQQYFRIDSGSRTLTVFHTEDAVSFDVEHYGNFSMSDEELLQFLESSDTELNVFFNPAEEYPELAEKRPNMYEDTDEHVATLKKKPDGSLQIEILSGTELKVTLTPGQTETLEDSITVGEVERYEDGQYPVEGVSRSGVRDRADH